LTRRLKLSALSYSFHILAAYNEQQLLKGKGDKSITLLYANRPTDNGKRVIYKPK